MSEELKWIDWSAGKCPVSLDHMVVCRFRDGAVIGPSKAGGWAIGIDCWQHEGKFRDYDIVAYSDPTP